MVIPDSALAFPQSLTPSQIADVRLAASTMTGAKRRAFEAEMPLKYCEGTPLQAETTCGWSRRTVALGGARGGGAKVARGPGVWARTPRSGAETAGKRGIRR